MSQITPNLRYLTEKVPWVWENKHSIELKNLKGVIASTSVLGIFDDKKQIVVQTDASKDGLGCVILQEGKPIAFASRKKLKKSF